MVGGKRLAVAAAIVSCCPLLLIAQKPPKPPKPGGGGSTTAAIAYEAQNRDGFWDLMVMGADGSGQTKLLTGGDNRTPAWSPDGEWIAFSRTNVAEPGIYMVRRDGTGLCRIVATDAWPFGSPTWSPAKINDNYKIIFVQRPGGAGRTDVYVTDAVCGASGAHQLTQTATYLEQSPAWSSNNELAVGTDADGIHVYDITIDAMGNVALGAANNITASSPLAGFVVNSPTWNADGTALVITAASQSKFDLWMVPVDDPSNAQRLTDTPDVSEGRVSWSPDSSRIVYDRDQKAIHSVPIQTQPAWTLGSPAQLVIAKGGTSGLARPSWRPVN